MPIHDLGYRSLGDHPRNLSFRWLIIAAEGMRLAWKNVWVKRLTYLVFVPILVAGIVLFVFELSVGQNANPRAANRAITDLVAFLGMPASLQLEVQRDPSAGRYYVWTYLLLQFLHTFQTFHLTLLIGVVAPPLISQDLLRKTFVLYFSRPIRRVDYLLGKASVLWGYGLILTTLPALLLFTVGVCLSPSLSVLQDVWQLPFRILLSSALVLVPTVLVALMFSSFTTSSRYASFAWFALWIVGYMSYRIMHGMQVQRGIREGRHQDPVSAWNQDDSLYYMLSPHTTLGRVQEWALGVRPLAEAKPAIFLVGAITVVAFFVLYRRIHSPMRA